MDIESNKSGNETQNSAYDQWSDMTDAPTAERDTKSYLELGWHERTPIIKDIIDGGLNSGEMKVLDRGSVSREQCIEANRAAYGDVQKRRAFIAQMYPVLTQGREWDDPELKAVPESIREEFSNGGKIANRLLQTASGDGGQEGFLQLPNGTIVSFEQRQEEIDSMLAYEESRRANDQILDLDALSRFEAPRSNVEETNEWLSMLSDKIRSCESLDEVKQFSFYNLVREGNFIKPAISTDIEATISNKQIVNTITEEVLSQENTIRQRDAIRQIEDARSRLDESEALVKQLEDEYNNANPIKRALLMISGHGNRLSAARMDVSSRKSLLTSRQARYDRGLSKWDPASRSWTKGERESD